jgi:D-alanine--poly(phosphoribitol) ligase subunit 1
MPVRSGRIRPAGTDAATGSAPAPSLPAMLRDAGRCAADLTAVRHEAGTLSYRQLWELAAGLRERLDAAGLPPGARILLTSADRGLLVASLLGTLIGGRVPIVLPAGTEAERRGYLIEAARPDATVTDDAGWAGSTPLTLRPDGPPADPWRDPYPVDRDDPAYIVFTSGSTGRPKAVLLPHRSLAANIRWQVRHSGSAARRSSQYAAVGFDSFLSEVLSTLGAGGELHVVPERLRVDAAALLDWIARTALTRVFLPYVALQALAAASTDGDPPLAVRQLYVAGEQLVITPKIRGFFRRHSGTRLINRYGPSETHCVVVHELPDTPDRWETRPPLGLPLEHCEIVLQPVAGSGTEAIVLGDPVGLGYLPPDSPGADRFGELPDGAGVPRPAYRTGDLMEVTDGLLYFVGRVDHQVKIRGVRVELEGIEAQARRVPEVLHACAVVEPAPSGASVLRLALVPAPGAPADLPDRVRAELQRSFPVEVLPQSYHLLAALPLTERGKVDRPGVLDAIGAFR